MGMQCWLACGQWRTAQSADSWGGLWVPRDGGMSRADVWTKGQLLYRQDGVRQLTVSSSCPPWNPDQNLFIFGPFY